jgi:hypothetical protein
MMVARERKEGTESWQDRIMGGRPGVRLFL